MNEWVLAFYVKGYSFAAIGRAVGRTRQRIEQIVRSERQRARLAAGVAYRRGDLAKPAFCESCLNATDKLAMHHDDYSKPLAIRWLCQVCHVNSHPHGPLEAQCPICGRLFIARSSHGTYIRAGRQFSCRSEACKFELRSQLSRASRLSATTCQNGHLYDERNCYVRPDGGRRCRRCMANTQQRYRSRRMDRAAVK